MTLKYAIEEAEVLFQIRRTSRSLAVPATVDGHGYTCDEGGSIGNQELNQWRNFLLVRSPLQSQEIQIHFGASNLGGFSEHRRVDGATALVI